MDQDSEFEVRLVESDRELNLVRAFWYEVYVEEMGRCKAEADHTARMLADPLDQVGDVLAAWHNGEVVGSVICTAANTGKISFYEAFYDMARLGCQHPEKTCVITRLMVAPDYRGGTLSLALADATFRHGTPQRGIEHVFIDCNLYLVPFFEYLGYRYWRGPVMREGYGEVQVMHFDCFDVDHLQSIGSPLTQTARELADKYDTNRITATKKGKTMNTKEIIHATFEEALATFTQSPAVRLLLSEDMTVGAYASSLRQIYYQARENPQIQAYATARFRGAQRETIKRFYQHATSEIGHDQLALNDLKALGEDVSSLPLLSPAPTTIALTAFAYYQAGHMNPVGYLGYLYFLEYLPTTAGAGFADALRRAGVPDSAMSFLAEHTTVDVHHNRMMDAYLEALVRTEDDVQSVAYAMRVTGDLYARMLEQAFLAPVPVDHWGAACEEAA